MPSHSYWLDWALRESLERGRRETLPPGERATRLLEGLAELETDLAELRERVLRFRAELDDGDWHH